MSGNCSFVIHAGARAMAHVRSHGLSPVDIACVPAAAGGPKGLALLPLDRLLFDAVQGWLRGARLQLIGASIGAWRMAAASMPEPLATLDRLADGYVAQIYPRRPSPRDVAEECRKLARAVLGGLREIDPPAGRLLAVVTARARGALDQGGTRGAFTVAAFANARSRTRLAAHMQRVLFTADGWFRTGDMGFMDERGSFKITDRKKDMIVVSGFKFFPNEIEDVVMLHPGVLEVAAVGVPDEKSGEMVKIFVVRKDPALTWADLLAHCRQHLTGYKVPKAIEFRTEPLPKTNIGKILRRELRTPTAA